MPFLIKFIFPTLVEFVFKLIMRELDKRVSDDKSKWSREMFEIAKEEQGDIQDHIVSAGKETGIYKKLMKK